MLLSKQVAGFFYHQYLCKETISVLDFLHRDNSQGKIASKSTDVGYMWSGVASHVQTCLSLSRGDYGWSWA